MSSAGDAAMTHSAKTGLSYTSGMGRWVLLVTVLGSAVASTDAIVVGVALPAIGRDFGDHSASLGGDWTLNAVTPPEATLLGLIGAESVPLNVDKPRA